ncbi:MAG: tetratricopeptide repeat protein [Acidobacteria bacterium]|nr:tetratricopeptide repeat protein [Acidobacteriota bacterium]
MKALIPFLCVVAASAQHHAGGPEKPAVLKSPTPDPKLLMMQAFWRYARGVAVAASAFDARLAGGDQAALPHWRKAVDAQHALSYDEPPPWYYPVRESLGGALLRNGNAAEAEAVFREALRRNPRNGRALFGLMESPKVQRKRVDAVAGFGISLMAWLVARKAAQ